jgi:CDP-4-dehydro-6-deoxyglucose reductase
MALSPWTEGEFIRIENESPTTRRFWIQIPSVDVIDYKPGQFFTFDLPIHEKKNKRWRSYSIASSPDGTNILEFVIVQLEGGAGTRYLFEEVTVGTKITLRGPLGLFLLPTDLSKEICFICTGTGIAPFRSMLNYLRHQTEQPPAMHLVFGTRTMDSILYRAEMEALAAEFPNFHYHPTLSREKSAEWTGRRGYVHEIYEEIFADHRDAYFYLCGWDVMLNEARQRLEAMGYGKKQIIYESYG